MNKICKGNLIPRINTQSNLGRAMKLTSIALFVFTTGVCASVHSQNMRVNIHLNNTKTQTVLEEIEKQTDYLFIYNTKEVDLNREVSVSVQDETVSKVLSAIFDGTNISYAMEGSNIMLMEKPSTESAPQQDTRQITGTVVDAAGVSVIGANVMVKGTTNGTITDIDGKFMLEVAKDAILQVSYIGYTNQEIPVGNQSVLKIALKEDTQALDEVVVIGYGSVRKKDVTTSVAIISTEDMQERPIVSAASAMQGKAAGVQVVQSSGKPGGGISVRVRGASSIQAGNEPLYVVDGMPMSDISTIAPSDIESMQVLKDASSAAIYGARAANGVVLITTKKGKSGIPQLKFNSYVGVSNVRKQPQALNTEQYLDYIQSINWLAETIPTEDLASIRNVYTNWADEVFRTGVNQNYQLSYSGGSEKNRYYISGGYVKDLGIVINSQYSRYNFRANMDTEIKKWLKIEANFSYTNSSQKEVPEGRADLGGVI